MSQGDKSKGTAQLQFKHFSVQKEVIKVFLKFHTPAAVSQFWRRKIHFYKVIFVSAEFNLKPNKRKDTCISYI